ncbi:MAG: hypothetical protein U0Y82_04465 [Thermoleophilia bacterium]
MADRAPHSLRPLGMRGIALPARVRDIPDTGRWVTLALLVYALLALLGVSTSSLGSDYLRQDPAHPLGTHFGVAQSIRSDEFLTDTPIALGETAVGGPYTTNPLTQPPGFIEQLPTGPVSSLVFFEGTLFRATAIVPDDVLFAARWWLPVLLLAVFTPLWFREITGSPRFGFLCAALVFFAPSNTWWSYRPTIILGFVFAGCFLVFPAMRALQRRRWVAGGALLLLSAIALARYPTNYQPFAIVLGLPVLATTLVAVLCAPGVTRRVRLGVVAAATVVSAGLFAGLLIENWTALQALLNTVYPGSRRSSGEQQHLWSFFSAPTMGSLLTSAPVAGNSNACEISTGFSVALVWAATLVAGARGRWSRRDVLIVAVPSVFAVFWVAWTALDWGGAGTHLPVASLVPPARAVAMLGMVCSLVACLVLSRWEAKGWGVPAVAGVLVAALTVVGGRSIRQVYYPSLPTLGIIVGALAAGVSVACITRYPRRAWPIALCIGFLVLLAGRVNPIILGLGDLRDSATARQMLTAGTQARHDHTVWASNSVGFDALMFATGVPSLSGRQQMGPDAAEWRKLDPTGANRQAWDRAGAYISFEWSTDPGMTFRNASPDTIIIRTSPCTLHAAEPALRTVASLQPLTGACLRPLPTARWTGQTIWRYATDGGPRNEAG